MAVPVVVVNQTSAVSQTTYTFTVAVSVPQGAAIVVVAGQSGAGNSTGVTDSQGNTYTGVTSSGTNEGVSTYVALPAHALTGGTDSITVSWGTANTQQKNITAMYVKGAIAVDLAATNNGSSSTATITGGTPAYSNELGIAIVQGANGTQPIFPWPAASGVTYTFLTGLQAAGQELTAIFYANLRLPFAQSLTATLGSSNQWAFLLVTFYMNQLTTPSVPDFIAGYGPQQSDMTALWSAPLAFFQNRVVFRAVEQVTATTLPSSGAITTIGYDLVLEDPFGGWNPSNFHWTPPAGYSGWYEITVTVVTTAPAAQNIILQPYVGGNAAYNWVNNIALSRICIPIAAAGAEGFAILWLTGGQDPVWGAASILNSASNLNTLLTPGRQSSIEVVWLGS